MVGCILSNSECALSSAEILQANDLLTQGVLLYKQVVEGRVNAGKAAVGEVSVPRGACWDPPALGQCASHKNARAASVPSSVEKAVLCQVLIPFQFSWSLRPRKWLVVQ